jgi:hypothetical protein
MDDVVATALITGAVGVSGSVATYFATKKQAEGTIGAAQQQSEVERERIQSELDRLRLEQEEPHLQHRQVVYHEYLDICNVIHEAYAAPSGLTIPVLQDLERKMEHCFNGVALFGTAQAFNEAGVLDGAIKTGINAKQFAAQHEQSYQDAVARLIDAMRKDTAPS